MIVNQVAWVTRRRSDYSALDSNYMTTGLEEEGWVGLLTSHEKVVVNGKWPSTHVSGTDSSLGMDGSASVQNDIYTALGKDDKSFVNTFVEGFKVTMDQMGAMVSLQLA